MAPSIDPVSPAAVDLQRVLIVRMSAIGDVVHALPVAMALRRRYPRARISWAVEDWTAPLLVGHPAIDRVVVFPAMRWANAGRAWMAAFRHAVQDLRSEAYDVSVDLQGLLKSSVVAYLSCASRRIGAQYQREGARLISQPVSNGVAHLHAVDDYLQCAQFLGAPASPVSFGLRAQPEAARAIARRLAVAEFPAHLPLIVMNPSASALWKTWPARHWSRVAGALSNAGAVVLVGGRDQQARHAEVARHAVPQPYDLTGRTTLPELVALLERCAVHIAPDTGSAHIAAALGRPVVGLYGPTPPWRKAPYGCEDLAAYHPGTCGVGCPRLCVSRRRCLRTVTPEELVAHARRALAAHHDLTAQPVETTCS